MSPIIREDARDELKHPTYEDLEAQLAEAVAEASHAAGLYRAEVEHRREAQAEMERLRAEQACIDIWLRRREPITHESATLRSVQEFVGHAEARLMEVVEAGRAVISCYQQYGNRGHEARCQGGTDGGVCTCMFGHAWAAWENSGGATSHETTALAAEETLPTSQPERSIAICKAAAKEKP